MSEDDIVGVGDYEGAAAGWGALKAVADAVRGQMAIVKETRGLLSMNQRIRLPGVCLARSETYLVVRVLRERRQGCLMGGDRQTHNAGILRSPRGQRALEMAGLRP